MIHSLLGVLCRDNCVKKGIFQVDPPPPLKIHEGNITNKHNRFKNVNWWEADQLGIYKPDRGVKLASTEKQIQLSGQSENLIRDFRISSLVQ